ncbi:uncharacterized protein LOC124452211 [Xenia sp. Carnegie-2017]|uniref:uncharacterized protein LOC124452211 n=1 Tax=Xenia sp. Carnegie-2017 TaxID=2897299 RepID=UPI001F034226|nr:uncharacterized protein LOC124452211 [Xenia sp. Carnegie-2017]
MHYSTGSSFYPSVFHNAFTEEHNFPLGKQCDVQEAFTRLCSNTKETAIGDAFNIGTQTRKTCMSCGNFEDSMPETQTSLIVSPRNGIDDLENAIRNCLEDTISSGCGLDEFEKGDETGNCNETFEEKANVQRENESPNYKYDVPGKQSNEVRWKEIQQLYDVLNKNKTICLNATHGYELKGEDFKTLEQPLLNQTYSVKHTGWLNDKIINAYTHLIVNAARENGNRVLAFDTLFYSRLRHCVVQRADEKKLVRMMFEKKSDYKLETYDYVIIPINENECGHWTVMIIDIWKTSIPTTH